MQQNRANGLEVVANQKEMNEPYIAGYTGRRANYITAFRTRQDEEDTYLAKYGTKEDSKASGTRNKKQVSFCSSICTITFHFGSLHFNTLILIWIPCSVATDLQVFCLQQNHAHGMNDLAEKHLKTEVDNQKEMNEQYTSGYRNKQYIAGYTSRQYIAGYRTRRDAKDNSITAKEALKNSRMQQKEHVCICFMSAHYTI